MEQACAAMSRIEQLVSGADQDALVQQAGVLVEKLTTWIGQASSRER